MREAANARDRFAALQLPRSARKSWWKKACRAAGI